MRLLLYDLVTDCSSLTFQPTQPVESNFEGSGDSDSDYADENEDDSFDYYGSGEDDEEDTIEDSYSPQQPTNTDFQNPRNNYQDPYAGQGWNPDPRDPYDPTYRNSNNQNNNFNSQFSPTQQVKSNVYIHSCLRSPWPPMFSCKKSDKILGRFVCPQALLWPGQPC